MPSYPNRKALQDLLNANAPQVNHPGLLMDRFAAYPTDTFEDFRQDTGQKPHIESTRRAAERVPANERNSLLANWDDTIAQIPGVRTWTQTTTWRLALHLAQASALENGSLCLHPIYGFPWLPGHGLKGLARAWAETYGRDEQPDASALAEWDRSLARIFGSAAAHADATAVTGLTEWERTGDVNAVEDAAATEDAAGGHVLGASSGAVIFLEAWPKTWPVLEADIVNNHHKDYYGEKGVGKPPGDWESPNPTYFLAVEPNTPFRFAVAPRNSSTSVNDLHRAMECLKRALQDLGAGAKTAAGYGYFGP